VSRILLLLLIGLACYGPAHISVAQTRRVDSAEVLKALLAFPAPTPRHAATPNATEETERPADFYDEKKVPPDDAPIEDLIDYWRRWADEFDRPDLTDTVRKRLFEACLANPKMLPKFLRVVPDNNATTAKIKELYDGAGLPPGIRR
jgi:hypothetical protein